jgi:DNA-binding MarR family transcriptional regulator
MKKTEAKLLFTQVQHRLVDMLIEMGSQKGRSPKASKLSAYLYLKNEYTQSELKKLSGLSLGTISNTLKEFVKQGFISREFRTDPQSGKMKYYYSANNTFLRDLTTLQQKSYTILGDLLNKLLELKENLEKSNWQQKQGYEEIRTFCDRMESHLDNQLRRKGI